MREKTIKHGFTLLELLITLSVVAGIIAVLLASFEGGFRVYERIRDFGSRESEIYLTGEMLEHHLGNLIPGGNYTLEERTLRFARGASRGTDLRWVEVVAPETGGLFYGSGNDEDVLRRQQRISLIPDGIHVRFAYADPENPDMWLSTWGSETNLPSAIRMIIDGNERDPDLLIERTILLHHIDDDEEDA